VHSAVEGRRNMAESIFWGAKGEYGPFTRQEDGWPHAGEVIRLYHRNHHMSASELALHYGEMTGERITSRWILKMEQQNKVPLDITRRRALAHILNIPPLLLGLASLESVVSSPIQSYEHPLPPLSLKQSPPLDIAHYDQFARSYWLLSYAGEEDLQEVISTITALEEFERQRDGASLRSVRTLLNAYYQLASDILRHQGLFAPAWSFANKAVMVTNRIGLKDFTAAALYRRGYTQLEWGIFGDDTARGQMNQEPHRKKLNLLSLTLMRPFSLLVLN
jgi:hypothetical protein